MAKVGFTGTRNGMTKAQKELVTEFLCNAITNDLLGLENFHHGDCVGADEEAHQIARSVEVSIVIHPPVNSSNRAFCLGAEEVMDEKSYQARNRDIVNDTDILLATPATMVETDAGGTWMTIRFARNMNKPIVIIWPDGTITKEGM